MIDYIIGIDPDTEKNGWAVVETATGEIHAGTAELAALIDWVMIRKSAAEAVGKTMRVVVEAGWVNQPNWHLDWRDSKQRAAAKGKSLGRNQQRGKDIVEMLRWQGVEVTEAPPLKKMWKGVNRKITHDELVRIVGKIEHTNQEGRDAALLAWVHAGMKIRLST